MLASASPAQQCVDSEKGVSTRLAPRSRVSYRPGGAGEKGDLEPALDAAVPGAYPD